MKKTLVFSLGILVMLSILITGCYLYYTAPSEPFVVTPLNDTTEVEVGTITLQWTASTGTNPIYYDVYFGTQPNPTTLISPAGGIQGTTIESPALQMDTTYYWKVVARNKGGRAVSNTWRFFTEVSGIAPSAPVIYSPANGALNLPQSVSLYWNASSLGTAPVVYDIYLDTNPSPVTKIVDGTSQLTRLVSGLWSDTTYYWKVIARNAFGTASSPVWNFKVQEVGTAPSTPTNLTPTDGATGVSLTPNLFWQAAGGTAPILYDVYLDTNPNPGTRIAQNVAETNFLSPTLLPSTTYFWRVEANNNFGGPVSGIPTQFTTLSTPTGDEPSTPVNLYPTAEATGIPLQIYFVWEAATGDLPITYDVYLGTQPGTGTKVVEDATQTHAPSPLLNPDTYYYWFVVAKNAFGEKTSVFSAFSTTIGGGGGDPASNLVLISPSNGQTMVPLSAILTWTCQGTMPITYHVWFGDGPTLSDPGDYRGTTTSPFYTPGTLQQGKTYYWKVFAANSFGEGVTSPVYSFTTLSSAPGGPIYLEKLPSGVGFQVKAVNYFTPTVPFVIVFESTTINITNMSMVPEFNNQENFGNFSVIYSTDAAEVNSNFATFSPSNLVLFTVITGQAGTIELDEFVSGGGLAIDPTRKSVTLP